MRTQTIAIALLSIGSTSQSQAATTDYLGTQNLQLKPSVSVGGEYRSNLYLSEGEDFGGEPAVAGTAILINPALTLQSQSSSLNLSLGGGYGARTFLQEELTNLNSFNDGRISANAHLLPNSRVSLVMGQNLTSNNRPVNHRNAENSLLRVYDNTTNAGLMFGSRNTLNVVVRGSYGYKEIQGVKDINGNRDTINQKNIFGRDMKAGWSFLPKTELFLTGAYGYTNWNQETIAAGDETTTISDSTAWNSTLGLSGQITNKTLIRLSLGYGQNKYGEGADGGAVSDESVDSLLEGMRGNLGLSFYPTASQQILLGYQRAFQDVYFTNYSVFNQLEAGYVADIMKRVNLNTKVSVRQDSYKGPVDRIDYRLGVNGGISVRF